MIAMWKNKINDSFQQHMLKWIINFVLILKPIGNIVYNYVTVYNIEIWSIFHERIYKSSDQRGITVICIVATNIFHY